MNFIEKLVRTPEKDREAWLEWSVIFFLWLAGLSIFGLAVIGIIATLSEGVF